MRRIDSRMAVLQSLDKIESCITERLTVENLAASAYFSKYHYQRLFREVVGDSVMEYVAKRKLSLAGRELLESNASILDIAMQFGYGTHEGFTRSFKAHMGMTPTEYRKYSLVVNPPKTVRERVMMAATKGTDEMIQEFNAFIVDAKKAAEQARMANTSPAYVSFWRAVAEQADTLAAQLEQALPRVSGIARQPDAITNRFAIVKAIEDNGFEWNLLLFNIRLTIARANQADAAAQKPLCERFVLLAQMAHQKTEKIVQMLNELATLIFEDMRKTATEKLQVLAAKGKAAAAGVKSYPNIRMELDHLARTISDAPCGEITIAQLEDYAFMLKIIRGAAGMEVLRNPTDKVQFDALEDWQQSLDDTLLFFEELVWPEEPPVMMRTAKKVYSDAAFQGNILLFYVRGELAEDKLGQHLNGEQKAVFHTVCDKINDAIQGAQQAEKEAEGAQVADLLYEGCAAMETTATELGDRGGAVKYLAQELRWLADHVAQYAAP